MPALMRVSTVCILASASPVSLRGCWRPTGIIDIEHDLDLDDAWIDSDDADHSTG